MQECCLKLHKRDASPVVSFDDCAPQRGALESNKLKSIKTKTKKDKYSLTSFPHSIQQQFHNHVHPG